MRRVIALFVAVETAVVIFEAVDAPIALGMLAVLVERAATRDKLLRQSTASTTASWNQSAHFASPSWETTRPMCRGG